MGLFFHADRESFSLCHVIRGMSRHWTPGKAGTAAGGMSKAKTSKRGRRIEGENHAEPAGKAA
jgi:hypothetical protein